MNDYVIITINGVDYYCPSNLVHFITDDLINTGSSTITLYGSLREYNNQFSGYPTITLNTYQKPIYRGSYNAQQSTLNISSVTYSQNAKLLRQEIYKSNFNYFIILLIGVFIVFRRNK